MNAFSYTRASSVAEASSQLTVSGRSTVALAGGVDLLDLLKEGIQTPDVVVSLAAITGLSDISTLANGTIRIGARTTLATISENSSIINTFPALAEASGEAATPQIRNMATLGGNLLQRPRCWYFRNKNVSCLKKGGSSCPAIEGDNRYLAVLGGGPCYAVTASSPSIVLTALGAVLQVTGTAGDRQVSIDQLYVSPSTNVTKEHSLNAGDIITGIDVSPLSSGSKVAYQKVRAKEAYDWAMAEVAVKVTISSGKISECRIVLGGVAPVPWRASSAESYLLGKSPSAALMVDAAQLAVSDAQPLSGNAYKVPVAQHLVEQTLLEATGLD